MGTPQNSVSYDGTPYAVDFGLLYDQSQLDNHVKITFGLTDGKYLPYLVPAGYFRDLTIWDPSEASIEVLATLYSPGTATFQTGTFEVQEVSDINDSSLADSYFITAAYVAVDTDGNKELIKSERINVTGGTIKVDGERPNYKVTYNLKLEDGGTLQGTYSGEYLDTDEDKK